MIERPNIIERESISDSDTLENICLSPLPRYNYNFDYKQHFFDDSELLTPATILDTSNIQNHPLTEAEPTSHSTVLRLDSPTPDIQVLEQPNSAVIEDDLSHIYDSNEIVSKQSISLTSLNFTFTEVFEKRHEKFILIVQL